MKEKLKKFTPAEKHCKPVHYQEWKHLNLAQAKLKVNIIVIENLGIECESLKSAVLTIRGVMERLRLEAGNSGR